MKNNSYRYDGRCEVVSERDEVDYRDLPDLENADNSEVCIKADLLTRPTCLSGSCQQLIN